MDLCFFNRRCFFFFKFISQIWNWFQNRRYALRAKGNKAPGKLNVSSMPRALDPTNQMRNVFPPSAGPKPTHMTGPITTPSPSGILEYIICILLAIKYIAYIEVTFSNLVTA